VVVLEGPRAVGKSTLLACLAGMDDPDGGTVYLAAERLSRRSERERAVLRARNIGMLFQSSNLIETLTVRENAALMQQFGGRRDRPAIERTLDALGISERADALPSQLSGGELVRAGLAVAIADKLDTLAGIFAIGEKPTGTKDPFGLRRAALGVQRILIEKALDLDLRKYIDQALAAVRADIERVRATAATDSPL